MADKAQNQNTAENLNTNESQTTQKPKQETSPKPLPKINYKLLLLPVVFALLGYMAYRYRGEVIVARVDGKNITRFELLSEMQANYARTAVDSLITKQLISNAAAKEGFTVSENDLNAEIDKIRQNLQAQGLTLEMALEQQGVTLEQVEENIKINILLDKLVADKIVVSDEDINKIVDEEIKQNPKLTEEEINQRKEQVREQLVAQNKALETSNYLEELRSGADIQNWMFPQKPTQQ